MSTGSREGNCRRLLRMLARGRRRRADPVRRWVGASVTVFLVFSQSVKFEPARWWRSTSLVASLGLTQAQLQRIDRAYEQHLLGRQRCIERLVEASNRVDRLIRYDADEDDMLEGTEEVIKAAADEREMTEILNEEIVALLSPDQRRLLAQFHLGVE